MTKVSALQFETFYDFINYVVSPASHYEDRPKTLEEWSKRLGYRSASLLSMVIKGQRSPSFDLIQAFGRDLKLSEKEIRYISLLVQLDKEKRKNKDVGQTLAYLKKIRRHKTYSKIDPNEFSYISQWYFFAIKNLVETKGFIEDYAWIAKRLKNKVTPAQVREAIIKMLEIGVLVRNHDGYLAQPNDGFSTGNDIPNLAFRNHQKQMMKRASEALDEVQIHLRQISSLTLPLDLAQIGLAKERILRFFDEFNNEFSAPNEGTDVYQLNVQLFPHSSIDSDNLN